jgi:hypothetical protein
MIHRTYDGELISHSFIMKKLPQILATSGYSMEFDFIVFIFFLSNAFVLGLRGGKNKFTFYQQGKSLLFKVKANVFAFFQKRLQRKLCFYFILSCLV